MAASPGCRNPPTDTYHRRMPAGTACGNPRRMSSTGEEACSERLQTRGKVGIRSAAEHHPGTLRSSSSSQTSASESLGARQSPRGESDPPEPTLGPLGTAERLNWLVWKKRKRKTRSHFLIVARSYCRRADSGKPGGQSPRVRSDQAWWARK